MSYGSFNGIGARVLSSQRSWQMPPHPGPFPEREANFPFSRRERPEVRGPQVSLKNELRADIAILISNSSS